MARRTVLTTVGSQSFCASEVGDRRSEVGVDAGCLAAVQTGDEPGMLRSEANQGHSHRRAVYDPRLIGPRVEDDTVFDNPVKHGAVATAANRVGGDEVCCDAGLEALKLGRS